MPGPINRIGVKYGMLTALEMVGMRHGARVWRCRCDCGKERDVYLGLGTSVVSCGCANKPAHFAANPRTSHGMRRSPEYGAWRAMRDRCLRAKNPAFHNYGGRGITVCERWMKFENFYADMGPRPDGLELDRINNSGNYEPGNCRWTTRSENIKNTRPRLRDSQNRFTSQLA